MLDQILQLDKDILVYLNSLGNTQWDGFWLLITHKFSAIPLYLLLIFFSVRYFGVKKTLVVVVMITLLITVSDQTSNLFKYGFKRLRPCHENDLNNIIRLVKSSCGGKYSFFSAHAANSAAIAMFFGSLLRKKFSYLLPILLIWSLFVAYSRIYIGVHYPLDVLAGFMMGTFYALLFYRLLKWIFRKFNFEN